MSDDSPVWHTHVKVVDIRYTKKDGWFALFEEPDGTTTWMNQPVKPTIGDEQILYMIKADSEESRQMTALAKRGASQEEAEQFLKDVLERYGAVCHHTWDEARALIHNTKRPH